MFNILNRSLTTWDVDHFLITYVIKKDALYT